MILRTKVPFELYQFHNFRFKSETPSSVPQTNTKLKIVFNLYGNKYILKLFPQIYFENIRNYTKFIGFRLQVAKSCVGMGDKTTWPASEAWRALS